MSASPRRSVVIPPVSYYFSTPPYCDFSPALASLIYQWHQEQLTAHQPEAIPLHSGLIYCDCLKRCTALKQDTDKRLILLRMNCVSSKCCGSSSPSILLPLTIFISPLKVLKRYAQFNSNSRRFCMKKEPKISSELIQLQFQLLEYPPVYIYT